MTKLKQETRTTNPVRARFTRTSPISEGPASVNPIDFRSGSNKAPRSGKTDKEATRDR